MFFYYPHTEHDPVQSALFLGVLMAFTYYILNSLFLTVILGVYFALNIIMIILKIQIHFLLKKQRKIEQARCKKELEQLEAKWNLQHQRFQEDLENTLRALSDSQQNH